VAAGVAITWIGHATVLVELDGARVLTDPVLGGWTGPLRRLASPPASEAGAGADVVLLSHLHADHADPPSLRKVVSTGLRVVAPRGAADWLRERGIADVAELGPGEELRAGPLRIEATFAAHGGQRHPFGVDATPVGYIMRGSRSVYFAGDTDLFVAMVDLAGTIDVALLPVWGWGRSLGAGHLDPDRAAQAAARIAPRVAVPIHWGTLAPPWPYPRPADPQAPARAFAAATARVAPDVDVRVLQPGERVELP
jgi:L-ascorbate metabolism protein UlaG (beta-lactamase superfamily)